MRVEDAQRSQILMVVLAEYGDKYTGAWDEQNKAKGYTKDIRLFLTWANS